MSVPCVLFRVARSFTLLGASGGLLRRSSVLCRTAITRKITSKMDHLERTASNYRQSGVYSARCVVDSLVEMRVGGDFFYDPLPSDPSVDLLLVAGGVGINPLYSILTHAADLLRQNPHNTEGGYNIGSTHLCYSAKNTQELLFKKNIIDICQEFPDKFSCDFHVTAQTTEFDPQLQPYVNRGRVSKEKLRGHVDPDTTLCYLCGPPPMIESLVQTLLDSGLSQDRILFEKWW